MLENLTKQQKFFAVGIVLAILIMAVIVWILIRQKYAEDERIREPTLEELKKSTKAPGGSLLTPQEEQELIESTTVPELQDGESGGLSEEEIRALEKSTTAPGN